MDDKLFSNLKELQKDMLKILGDVTSITSPFAIGDDSDIWKPKFDMFETDDYLVILIDLAGIRKEAIEFSNTNEFIEVVGERIINLQSENVCFYNLEIEAGRFHRKIFFPEIKLDYRNPTVIYDKGFLKISFVKI